VERNYPKFLLWAAFITIVLSVVLYSIHYLIFEDSEHIFIFGLHDIAFLPIEIFIVVIVIERLLARREKQAIQNKLNMVIGAFFSEVGGEILGKLIDAFPNQEEIKKHLVLSSTWKASDFQKARNFASGLTLPPDPSRINLVELRDFFKDKRLFMVSLLENPNLLEREDFSDLLWSTFHLAEELEARPDVKTLKKSDLNHISGDIKRFYGHLLSQWLSYVEHLKGNYPYLFSLILRTHPFQTNPSAVVE
jgi:hypothetical protein